MKKHLLLLFAALLPLLASAEKVEIGGIWYNLVSKVKQAEVTSSGGTKYSGSITIPATVTYEGEAYSVTSIGESAFFDCSSLTAITLPEGVTSIGNYAFSNCTNLTAITLPESLTSIGHWAFDGCTSLTAITLPESVTSIGINAFDGCSSLASITLPEGVKGIGSNTFSGCLSLTAITLPEGVKSIGSYAFFACRSLTDITLPESLTSIGLSAFQDCRSLTSINIPEGVKNIGERAFEGCSSLTAVTIPEGVTSIGGEAFYGCTSLTAITLPEGVTSIGNYAFSGCSSLTAITLPENSQLTSIGEYAFSGCSSLTAVHISNIEAWCKIEFGNSYSNPLAYAHNLYLNGELMTNLVIPEGVTSIENYAFGGCSSLTTIVLPKSVSSIGYEAFANCYELTDVYCNVETVPSTETNAFDGSYIEYATLHVPASAVNKYKNTAPWSSFGKVETLEITVDEITLSQSAAELIEGESLQLTATVSPDDAEDKSISWSSNNPSIATVDNRGKVTAIAPGTATITVIANDGSGVSASCEVTVKPASYVITYLIDGEQFFVETLTRGSAITLPEVPAKEGYTFSGWGEVPETMPAKDVTISGTFIANKYLVTFKIDDEVIIADSLEYGTAIVAPEAPEKEGYTFNGWGVVAVSVPAHDLTYEGSYSVNSYLLTITIDGEIVESDSIAYGTTITLPEAPTKEGYTFSGWSEVPETMPAKDVNISGTFIINKYLVTFKIGDEVIAADSLEYGATIVAPEAPEKEGHAFNGWGEVAGNVPAHDLTYEGSYSVNSYLLTITIDGEIVESDSIAYGTTITLPEAPAKEGYTFSGWSEIPETMPAKDITITGTFIANKYLITFMIDGVVISSESLEYGSKITPPNVPNLEGYTFSGWGEVAETVPAHNVTYEGSYSVNSYNIIYMVDGNKYYQESVKYGTVIELITEPTKEGHTFSGWSEIPETMPAEDITINGTFIINKYLVTFMIDDIVLASDSLEYGSTITLPSTPPYREGYTFSGWGEVAETVPANDVTYSAYYIANVYKVYYFVGSKLVNMVEVTYGEPIPEYIYEPTTEGDEFLGWIGDTYETMPAHDVTYTANIESGINQITIDNGQLNIYDLMGRKVTDTENLTGGIYIIGGKKVIIK